MIPPSVAVTKSMPPPPYPNQLTNQLTVPNAATAAPNCLQTPVSLGAQNTASTTPQPGNAPKRRKSSASQKKKVSLIHCSYVILCGLCLAEIQAGVKIFLW